VMPYSDEKVVETLIGIFLNGLTKKQNL
jgi:hypothetical protein